MSTIKVQSLDQGYWTAQREGQTEFTAMRRWSDSSVFMYQKAWCFSKVLKRVFCILFHWITAQFAFRRNSYMIGTWWKVYVITDIFCIPDNSHSSFSGQEERRALIKMFWQYNVAVIFHGMKDTTTLTQICFTSWRKITFVPEHENCYGITQKSTLRFTLVSSCWNL
jgi:hypothetical protein